MKLTTLDTKTHAHDNPHQTELEALFKADKGAAPMKAQIEKAVERAGPNGLTPDMFSAAGGKDSAGRDKLLINTVRRRFTDLRLAGAIRYHPDGVTFENRKGNQELAYVMGSESDLPKSRLRRLLDENAELKAKIEELEEELNQ
jgi:hypothetical protein